MTTSQIIEITSAASKQLEKVLAEQDQAGSMLRVMVMPGPNGAYQYMLGVEDNPTDTDVVIDSGELKVLVDGESVPLVEGAQIDYVDGLMRSGFVISNPNMPSGGGGGCGSGGQYYDNQDGRRWWRMRWPLKYLETFDIEQQGDAT